MHKIGDAQFRVMCDMWGVDEAIKAVKKLGMSVTKEQIEAAKGKATRRFVIFTSWKEADQHVR